MFQSLESVGCVPRGCPSLPTLVQIGGGPKAEEIHVSEVVKVEVMPLEADRGRFFKVGFTLASRCVRELVTLITIQA